MPTWSHGSDGEDTVERKRLRDFKPSREQSKTKVLGQRKEKEMGKREENNTGYGKSIVYRAFKDDVDVWMDGLSMPVWIRLRSKQLWLRNEQFSTVRFMA
ncbi:hypothetical protein L3X38_037595 [Prunus dulcis]|uniref:Uncharacterized protein n=1 Tax=Prunus dulcis TaxID=3755 RepID=A0AAD4YRE0_PRUDU|nr:hypothetical protein L3X38_037595 [Prunus dulcis]